MNWQKDESNTSSAWLSLVDPEGWWKAGVKFDGCVHFTRHFNVPFTLGGEDTDYIHICDVDEMIAMLQALKAEAARHFGEWPR